MFHNGKVSISNKAEAQGNKSAFYFLLSFTGVGFSLTLSRGLTGIKSNSSLLRLPPQMFLFP